MRVAHRPRVTTRASAPIVAALAALWLLAMLAGPAAAAGPTLRDPVVDPRAGGPSTTFNLRVTYADDSSGRHWAPQWVRVRIHGVTHWMSRNGDRDWSDGITYRWSGKLPLGTNDVAFEARSDRNVMVRLPAGTIVVAEPATPTPSAKPTAKPTPRPTARPTPRPTVRPPAVTHHTDPTPRPKPVAVVKPSPTATPVDGGVVLPPVVGGIAGTDPTPDGTPPPWLVAWPTTTPAPSPSAAAVALVPPSNGTDTSGGGTGGPTGPPAGVRPRGGEPAGPPALGPMAAALTFLGLPPHLPTLPLAPTLVTTTGVATASMALGIFGRKRRDDQQPGTDEELADLASQGIGVGADGAAGAADGDGEELDLAGDDLTPEMESLLPRWRRPSLMQARKADPTRQTDEAPRLRFEDGGSIEGQERRFVRYTVVRLLDAPDELRANEIGVLGTGDEVVVMERQGVYCLVQAPNGGRGWIHKMTLGDVVGPAPAAVETPTASLPVSADTWTMGEADVDDDVDEDVLAAYLASRQRAV